VNEVNTYPEFRFFKIIFFKGADVLLQDNAGAAPIHQAAFAGKKDCLDLLILHGADVECQDNDDGTALHNACFNGFVYSLE